MQSLSACHCGCILETVPWGQCWQRTLALWALVFGYDQSAHPFLHSGYRYFIMHGVQAALAELADAQDLGSCISDVRVQVP